MTYQPGIPTGSVPLNQDYINLQNNFTSLNTQFLKDHVPLTSLSNNGFHTAIHLVPQAAPINAPGFGQIYSTTQNDGFSNDQTLLWQTGTGNLNIQLTRNVLPKCNTNGYTFLPGPAGIGPNQGGIFLQWGVVAPTTSTTVAVSFAAANKNFPNACFGVQVTRQRPTADPGSSYEFYVDNTTVSTTGFSVINRDGHSYGFYWMAIGY